MVLTVAVEVGFVIMVMEIADISLSWCGPHACNDDIRVTLLNVISVSAWCGGTGGRDPVGTEWTGELCHCA